MKLRPKAAPKDPGAGKRGTVVGRFRISCLFFVNVARRFRSMSRDCSATALNAACETAMSYGALRLRTIRKLLETSSEVKLQTQFDFLEEHPVIRPLSDYSLESLSQFRKDRH